jgi:hypothetical protein
MPGFEPRVFIILVQANYLKGGQTASAGARLEVHASDKRQLVQEFGLNLEPNKEHNIGIRAVCPQLQNSATRFFHGTGFRESLIILQCLHPNMHSFNPPNYIKNYSCDISYIGYTL